jgi:hypothetical protein
VRLREYAGHTLQLLTFVSPGKPRSKNNGPCFWEAAVCYTSGYFCVFLEISAQEALGLAMLAMLAK